MPSVNGLPSVTEILQDVGLSEGFGFLSADKLADVRNRGQAVHATLRYHAEGVLDEATVHAIVQPYFEGYLRFVQEMGHEPWDSELELLHPWGFCGHLDRVGVLGGILNPLTVLIDFKTGTNPDLQGAKYQLAGYKILWNESERGKPFPIDKCYVLSLPGDGTYKLHDVTSDQAVQVFTAAFMVFQAKRSGR